MSARRRLDAELVRRGLVPSRDSARHWIETGRVLVGGAPADKPARLVLPGDDLRLLGPGPQFVSRAGGKLAAALDHFSIDPSGVTALDAGSSTGGFTDCLLQRGAALVHAVDVGTNQLHEKLRADPRVVVRERTDIRSVAVDDLGGRVDLTVGDLSFISLRLVLPTLIELTARGRPMLLLIKPQFEAGRDEASKHRGVIRDPAVRSRVVEEVKATAMSLGAAMLGCMESPVPGSTGNVEFMAHFVCEPAERAPDGASAPASKGDPR